MPKREKLSGEPLTILLVEDNPDHAQLMMRNFENHRIANRIIHLTDGEQALDYLHRRGEFADPQDNPRPHLIILDLRMPKIDGLEVLEDIRQDKDLEEIPVVILSSSDCDPDVARAYEHQVNSYLVKPHDFEKFTKLTDDLAYYCMDLVYYQLS